MFLLSQDPACGCNRFVCVCLCIWEIVIKLHCSSNILSEQETRMQQPRDPCCFGSWAWPLEAGSYCKEYCHQSGDFIFFSLSHLWNYLFKFSTCVNLLSLTAINTTEVSCWLMCNNWLFFIPADEFLPVFLSLCCSDWAKGTVCGFRVYWQPAHVNRLDDYLPVHLFSLQWGD